MFSLALFAFALCASAQGRAVNISNTWVLPEEGFPVFYRYFRDRISWYEADAVCQFHHANLVTVDTTAQYDAVRAYLKELDISSAVWVGLIRSNPDGDFTWTDYRGLGGEGYWSSAPDPRAAPLCAAANPAADYRWEARACGGPTVASFICELPVPQWALGNEGCMVKALPALTVLYLPESAAVQLTADCGLAGVKRVQCTGNVKREELLRELSCAEDEDISSTSSVGPSTVTSENLFTDQNTINELSTEENTTTEHEDDINQSSTIKPTPLVIVETLNRVFNNQQNDIYLNKNVNLDNTFNNNLQSNDIPKLGDNNNFVSNDLSEKIEDEKNKQHKMLHDEFARHGNFETIFTQPTDHFVPPLVMAKSKLSEDMTVLSLEEKHAQQIAEQRLLKHGIAGQDHNIVSITSTGAPKSTDGYKSDFTDQPLITTRQPITTKDDVKKDILKTIVPKKYNDKYYGLKSKSSKSVEPKTSKIEKTTDSYSTSTTEKTVTEPVVKYVSEAYSDNSDDEPTIDLTVIIKEPDMTNGGQKHSNYSSEIPKIEIIQNDTSISEPEIKLANPVKSSGEITQEISVKLPTKSIHNLTLTHQVIKITILKEENSSAEPTVFEVTTRIPEEDHRLHSTFSDVSTKDETSSHFTSTETLSTNKKLETTTDSSMTTTSVDVTSKATQTVKEIKSDQVSTTESTSIPTSSVIENVTMNNVNNFSLATNTNIQVTTDKDLDELVTDSEDLENNSTDTSQTIDDFQSPLLSAANEPLHRPNRSRRPQAPPNRNKFNPFRILG